MASGSSLLPFLVRMLDAICFVYHCQPGVQLPSPQLQLDLGTQQSFLMAGRQEQRGVLAHSCLQQHQVPDAICAVAHLQILLHV